MKKLQNLIIALLAAGSLSAQTSIPNGGFEKWNVTSWLDPVGYLSTSNIDNITKGRGPANVVQSFNPYHGKFALQLSTIVNGTDTLIGYILNGNTQNSGLAGGIPYNQKATGIRFYYKYTRTSNKDTGLVLAIFKNSGNTIGGAQIRLDTSKNYKLSFTSFSLPLTPDTIIFGAVSSIGAINNGKGYPGSVLTIDSVTYTGVTSQPVGLNGDFEAWQTDSVATPVQWYFQNSNYPYSNQTTDAYTGKYALTIKSMLHNSGGNNGADSSVDQQASTGMYMNHGGMSGGYPYSLQKDTLEVYYKYAPTVIGDSAVLQLDFKKNGVMFPFAATKTLGPASVYTKAQLAFDAGSVPDSVILVLHTQKRYNEAPADSGAILTVDNIRFLSQSVPLVPGFKSSLFVCSGSSITFTDTTQNKPTSWNWSFGGGGTPNTSSSQNPVIAFNTPGTYPAKLVVTNSSGSDSVTKTVSVVVAPKVTIKGSTTICSGTSTLLTASGGSSYTWSTTSTNDTVTVAPALTHTYSVSVIATGGCFHDTTFSVTVNTTPTLSISGPATICSGVPTTLTGGGAATYTWTPNTALSASTGVVVNATPGATITYTLNGSSAAGCHGAPLTEVVTVNTTPTLNISGPATICSGNATILTGGGASTYTWTPGGLTGSAVSVTPGSTTTYTLNGTSAAGCSASATLTEVVTVNPSPTITATTAPNSDTICSGNCVAINASGATAGFYKWSSGQTTSTVNVCPTSTTTYTVVGTAGNGCKDSTFDTITVNLCLGIAPVSKVTSANVYPNPNSGVFYVTMQNVTGNAAIEVYNILGEKVFAQTLSATSDESRIDMSDKPAGIYFYRVYSDKGTAIANGRFILK